MESNSKCKANNENRNEDIKEPAEVKSIFATEKEMEEGVSKILRDYKPR